MYHNSQDNIKKVIEQAMMCILMDRSFSSKTFREFIENEMNPSPQHLLRNDVMEEFKEFLNGLSTEALRELVVMFMIGRGDFEMDEWNIAMSWCETDVTEPAEYLFKNGHFLARWLNRFQRFSTGQNK
ncbi:MAG: DUF3775 domain-containing protein [Chloroflexi bacterium]|nr:DUF3775 domain-containing protein [Chloroflexota bacterium]